MEKKSIYPHTLIVYVCMYVCVRARADSLSSLFYIKIVCHS